jgi:hypothetical protein
MNFSYAKHYILGLILSFAIRIIWLNLELYSGEIEQKGYMRKETNIKKYIQSTSLTGLHSIPPSYPSAHLFSSSRPSPSHFKNDEGSEGAHCIGGAINGKGKILKSARLESEHERQSVV